MELRGLRFIVGLSNRVFVKFHVQLRTSGRKFVLIYPHCNTLQNGLTEVTFYSRAPETLDPGMTLHQYICM